jgi:hypothetical protein
MNLKIYIPEIIRQEIPAETFMSNMKKTMAQVRKKGPPPILVL